MHRERAGEAPSRTLDRECLRGLLTITEQSLKFAKGIIALVFAVPSSVGVVILRSIVQALLFASVRTLLGFIICGRENCAYEAETRQQLCDVGEQSCAPRKQA